MNNEDAKKLCMALVKAENQEEVVRILKEKKFWENDEVWRDYGDNENNFATIGNQQSAADSALVEKIINSVDAVLIRESWRSGVEPTSKEAPSSIQAALSNFFNITEGKLTNIDLSYRRKLSENIKVVMTGSKSDPCVIIADLGEGQTPRMLPETILSLTKSNKLKIPFVQGKFNMGGTGTLQFCGKPNNLQLIISKKDADIVGNCCKNDETKNLWGFTIVRREDPKEGNRSSTFRYFCPNNAILTFETNELNILPGEYPNAYESPMTHGTFIKLYEYQLQKALRTNIQFDLYNRLSLLLPNLALPVSMIESREGYRGHTFTTTLSGLSVRLDEDKRENLENGFPSSAELKIKGQSLGVQIYAFKRGQRENYSKNEGVVFAVNGQSHGFINKSFFERKSVGMTYLSDSILAVVDCSKLEFKTIEDLFMNSRDRLRDGDYKDEIESQLEEIIKNHAGLRDLKEKRRKEEVAEKLTESKPLVDVLNQLIIKSPTLARLFVEGSKITNPFSLIGANTTKSIYEGKEFPTYFRLAKDFTEEKPKLTPINHRFRVQFETDVENNFFNRDKDPGEILVNYNGNSINDFSCNLWNGIATFNIQLPEDAAVNDILNYTVEVNDINLIEPIKNQLFVKVEKAQEYTPSENGGRKEPANDEPGESRERPSFFGLPNIIPLSKNDWGRENFDEYSALLVKDTGTNGYDFFVNIDNVYLLNEIKQKTRIEPEIIRKQFESGLVLIGLALIDTIENKKRSMKLRHIGEETSTSDLIYDISKAIAPVIIPMIESLNLMSDI